jgi:uncharacterized protein (UPF0333 family)
MNPVIRIALLLVALLAVVIAGSYFYSHSVKSGNVTDVPERGSKRFRITVWRKPGQAWRR